ncbi:integrase core domain-containing protein, partial [Chengkuizengella axinellae]
AKAFIDFCKKNRVTQSMSRAGCPYDNAAMESFFGKLKNEHLHHYYFENDEQLQTLIHDYIYGYYHHIRPHSALGGMTPMQARYA